MTMTADLLSSIVGILLSLAASYLPGFSGWYGPLDASRKRLVMLGLLAGVALAVYGLACAGWGGSVVTCDETGITAIVRAFVAALIANQATYLISPQPTNK